MKQSLLPSIKKMIHQSCMRGIPVKWEFYEDSIIVIPDGCFMMIVDREQTWIDFLLNYRDPSPGFFNYICDSVKNLGIAEEVDIRSFTKKGRYWIYEANQTMRFDNTYMKYFINRSDLTYDLICFPNGNYMLAAYEYISSDSNYMKCGLIMGMR